MTNCMPPSARPAAAPCFWPTCRVQTTHTRARWLRAQFHTPTIQTRGPIGAVHEQATLVCACTCSRQHRHTRVSSGHASHRQGGWLPHRSHGGLHGRSCMHGSARTVLHSPARMVLRGCVRQSKTPVHRCCRTGQDRPASRTPSAVRPVGSHTPWQQPPPRCMLPLS